MLVQCPQCSAAYDFPDDRVTEKGLRAACGRCKLVMIVKPPRDGGEKAVVEIPPTERKKKVKRPRRRTAPPPEKRPKSERPKRSDSIVSDTTRDETNVDDDEPSIVIDMAQLNDAADSLDLPAEPEPEPESEADQEARRQAESAAAFAPLSVAPVQLTNPRYAPPMPASFDNDEELPRIRQATGLKMFLVLLLLGALGFVVFVAWKNDWGPIWENPKEAVRVALQLEPEAAAAPVTEAPPIVEKQSAGKLEVEGVSVEWLAARAVLVSGTVNNKSDRIQGAIGLDVTLRQGSQLLGNRVVPCCEVLAADAAKQIARDGTHAHFDRNQRTGKLRLQPGQRARFTAILRRLPADADHEKANAQVRIKYAEPERVDRP